LSYSYYREGTYFSQHQSCEGMQVRQHGKAFQRFVCVDLLVLHLEVPLQYSVDADVSGSEQHTDF